MRIVKVIEVLASSDTSFEDAVRKAVEEASKSIKNIKSIWVKEMNSKVENNKIVSYGIIAKISFEVE